LIDEYAANDEALDALLLAIGASLKPYATGRVTFEPEADWNYQRKSEFGDGSRKVLDSILLARIPAKRSSWIPDADEGS
jgi:hypothetical protein